MSDSQQICFDKGRILRRVVPIVGAICTLTLSALFGSFAHDGTFIGVWLAAVSIAFFLGTIGLGITSAVALSGGLD